MFSHIQRYRHTAIRVGSIFVAIGTHGNNISKRCDGNKSVLQKDESQVPTSEAKMLLLPNLATLRAFH